MVLSNRQITILIILVSASLARPVLVEENRFEQPGAIDPQLINWLQRQDPSGGASLNDNSGADNINTNVNSNNPRSWKDIFKVMAQLNDYYVLFGRARWMNYPFLIDMTKFYAIYLLLDRTALILELKRKGERVHLSLGIRNLDLKTPNLKTE